MDAVMYLRFVHDVPVDGLNARQGFLAAAYLLNRNIALDDSFKRSLAEHISWSEDILAQPDRFNRSKSKGAWRRNTKGLSWFRSSATDHIDRAIALNDLLAQRGIVIATLRTDRIGYVVYQDDYQVVAEPFADTPR
ncbi:hypothetical protein [Yoonia sp. SDW83-1]|uniref:hypothetical protein n=1 Tax=Yoonia sp. SDW83-1 TaxID=3366945 RepID=UPI00398C52E8